MGKLRHVLSFHFFLTSVTSFCQSYPLRASEIHPFEYISNASVHSISLVCCYSFLTGFLATSFASFKSVLYPATRMISLKSKSALVSHLHVKVQIPTSSLIFHGFLPPPATTVPAFSLNAPYRFTPPYVCSWFSGVGLSFKVLFSPGSLIRNTPLYCQAGICPFWVL